MRKRKDDFGKNDTWVEKGNRETSSSVEKWCGGRERIQKSGASICEVHKFQELIDKCTTMYNNAQYK